MKIEVLTATVAMAGMEVIIYRLLQPHRWEALYDGEWKFWKVFFLPFGISDFETYCRYHKLICICSMVFCFLVYLGIVAKISY